MFCANAMTFDRTVKIFKIHQELLILMNGLLLCSAKEVKVIQIVI
jgi:hypothetical protein